jgi:hypothetical protein
MALGICTENRPTLVMALVCFLKLTPRTIYYRDWSIGCSELSFSLGLQPFDSQQVKLMHILRTIRRAQCVMSVQSC